MPVIIRIASESDAESVARIYAPVVSESAISFELEPPDALEMARRIRNTDAKLPWIVCVSGDNILGYAYASRFRDRPAYQWTVEVSAYVRSDVRHCGVGSGLYTSLLGILRLQGFRTAVAVLTVPNAASEALHRGVGFTTVGTFANVGYKLGSWHNVLWLELSLLPHLVDPPPPLPLEQLYASTELVAALNAGQVRVRAVAV